MDGTVVTLAGDIRQRIVLGRLRLCVTVYIATFVSNIRANVLSSEL